MSSSKKGGSYKCFKGVAECLMMHSHQKHNEILVTGARRATDSYFRRNQLRLYKYLSCHWLKETDGNNIKPLNVCINALDYRQTMIL